MEPTVTMMAGLLAILGLLLRWLHTQARDNKMAVEQMSRDTYTKAETNERIDLKLRPIEVGIDYVKEELKELKQMIGRLLDEKNK